MLLHADTILRRCGLIPTTHEPCLYSGLVQGERVLFMRQVDDFAVAAPSQQITNILFDMIDDAITFPLKRMGLVTLRAYEDHQVGYEEDATIEERERMRSE